MLQCVQIPPGMREIGAKEVLLVCTMRGKSAKCLLLTRVRHFWTFPIRCKCLHTKNKISRPGWLFFQSVNLIIIEPCRILTLMKSIKQGPPVYRTKSLLFKHYRALSNMDQAPKILNTGDLYTHRGQPSTPRQVASC